MIESSLRKSPGFPKDVQVEGKLRLNLDGYCHENYFFAAGGQDLVLRLAKRFRSLLTPEETRELMPREAQTLRQLAENDFGFVTPELICPVTDEAGAVIGLIESCLYGIPLTRHESKVGDQTRLELIADVAASVHQLPKSDFAHLPSHPDSESHVRAELAQLPASLFAHWPVAALAKQWIEAHVTKRPSTVLHGDLLPQNLLWDLMESGEISVIDWECASIGDPAYDLAIVTRGDRQPLKEPNGLSRLLTAYNAGSDDPLPATGRSDPRATPAPPLARRRRARRSPGNARRPGPRFLRTENRLHAPPLPKPTPRFFSLSSSGLKARNLIAEAEHRRRGGRRPG